MNIQQATRQYEIWLSGHLRVVDSDLEAKHELMANDEFSFLRATFYRWAQLFPALCQEAARAPAVLAVGDLHVENYGTWRDSEGRLIWGINDFDEVYPLPYTIDLVRLATSAWLASQHSRLALDPASVCSVLLEGYAKGLEDGGEPFVLSEKHRYLREMATNRLRDPTLYWERFAALPAGGHLPAKVRSMLKRSMPERGLAFRVAHRRAGLGSLGRERFTALAEWCGSMIAREAKALLPSACVWAGGLKDRRIYYSRMIASAVRAPDPFLEIKDGWVLRRLAPYCSRIELSQLPRSRDEEKLLLAMGRELANAHLGSIGAVAAVRRDLRRRKSKWLRQAVEAMAKATRADWRDWRACPVPRRVRRQKPSDRCEGESCRARRDRAPRPDPVRAER